MTNHLRLKNMNFPPNLENLRQNNRNLNEFKDKNFLTGGKGTNQPEAKQHDWPP